MLPPISDVTHITLAHCDAVGRGYPPHQFSVTINSNQSCKVNAGVFERLFNAISGNPYLEYALIDGTIVQVHQKATGAKGGHKHRPSDVRGEV